MEEILNKLYSYANFGIKLGLENMFKILEELGSPQNSYRTIHIAGTNGKGSVSSILENVFLEYGNRVGKYVSPHLVSFNERIVFNREMISDEEVVSMFQIVENVALKLKLTPTFFEITTAMMFLYFKKKNADIVIVETGMGGRYDATNVLKPIASVITSISMDHSEYLGENLKKIAYEKAGIIKKGVPLFFADKKEEVKEIFIMNAEEYYDVLSKENYKIELDKENIKTKITIENEEFLLPLFGYFQGENFILAYNVLKYLNISNEVIKRGILKIKWPGRFEIVGREPFTILDGAHNADSAEKLKENIKFIFENKKDVIFITSILKDKDIDSILENFSEAADTIIFTSLEVYKRGLNSFELEEYGKKYFKNVYSIPYITNAYKHALDMNLKAIVVSGSLYLIGEFKKEVFNS